MKLKINEQTCTVKYKELKKFDTFIFSPYVDNEYVLYIKLEGINSIRFNSDGKAASAFFHNENTNVIPVKVEEIQVSKCLGTTE